MTLLKLRNDDVISGLRTYSISVNIIFNVIDWIKLHNSYVAIHR